MSAALDDAYNTRKWAPDFERTLTELVARGEAVRASPGFRRSVAWGAGPNRVLDFVSGGTSRGPLILFLHGGYWQYRGAGRDVGTFLAPRFVAADCAFAAATYELCPAVDMDGMVGQIDTLLDWLTTRSASELGYRIDRLVLIGHSAGAHLAAMAALGSNDRGRPPIAGVCGVGGLFDLRPLVETYLNGALRMDAETAWRNSPLRLVRAGAPPFVLAYGALESPAFAAQSGDFAQACAAQGVEVELLPLDGRDHYSAIVEVADGNLGSVVLELAHRA